MDDFVRAILKLGEYTDRRGRTWLFFDDSDVRGLKWRRWSPLEGSIWLTVADMQTHIRRDLHWISCAGLRKCSFKEHPVRIVWYSRKLGRWFANDRSLGAMTQAEALDKAVDPSSL